MAQDAPHFVGEDVREELPEVPAGPRVSAFRKLIGLDFDVYLLLTVGVLVAIGLLMVFSTTFDWSYYEYGSPTTVFMQQVRSALVGLGVMALLSRLDYRWVRRFVVPMIGVTLALLAVLLILPIEEIWGARRAFFNGSVQPGEMAELVVIIYMAAWLASKREKIRQLTYGLLPFMVLVGLISLLVVAQPDLSTAALIIATSIMMFLIAGADWLQLLASGGLIVAVILVVVFQFGYARDRIDSYFASINDLRLADYQQRNARIAFANGGLFGVGLGESRQKFGYLPTPHTDSIFAVIGEELGLLGCAVVVGLYIMLIYRGFKIARESPDAFGSMLAAGITCLLAFQALMNIAVMTALLPVTGVPLPFISFGGSSLVVSLAGVGIMLSISRQSSKQAVPERRATVGDMPRRHARAAESGE